MTTPSRLTALALATIAAGAALGLSACGADEEPQPRTPTGDARGTGAVDPAPSEHPAKEPEDGEAAEQNRGGDRGGADESDDKDATSDKPDKTDDSRDQLAQARKEFAGLVPDELFERFDSCTPNGLEDSLECSGGEVGQFQFFKSDTKAASTTQVLTELRSSHVVEDRNDRVVGWSTLGNTAILSVVDNERGLVVQQMVSTDQVDPKNRIFELGLAREDNAEEH